MAKIVGIAKITCVAKIIAAAKIIGMAQMKMALTRCSRSTRQRIINKSDGTAKTRLPTVQEFSGLLPVMRRQE